MNSSQPNIVLVDFPNGTVNKRQYRRKQAFDHVRDVIAAATKNGRKSKDILAHLARLGVSMTIGQLNRLKDEWDLNGKHLHPRQKSYILRTENRAQKSGKNLRGWWILKKNKDGSVKTRVPVTKTQLDVVRNKESQDVDNATPSPGPLMASPADLMAIDTPEESIISSPGTAFESNHEMGSVNSLDAGNINQQSIPFGYSENTPNNHLANNDRKAVAYERGTSEEYFLTVRNETEQEFDTTELHENFNNDESSSNDTNAYNADSGTLCTELSIATNNTAGTEELLQGITDGIVQLMKEEDSRGLEHVEGLPDALTTQEFVEDLSSKFRQQLAAWMDKGINLMQSFISKVEELRATGELNRKECDSVAWLETGPGLGVNYQLPYQAARCIFDNTWTNFVSAKGGLEISAEEVLAMFYDWFSELWQTFGSDTATLRQRDGKTIMAVLTHLWREDFQKRVVHIPYLVRTFGVSHWATLYALRRLAYYQYIYTNEASHPVTMLNLQILKTFGLFGACPFVGRIVHELIHPATGNLLSASSKCKLAGCWFSKSRAHLGDIHAETIKAAANFMRVLYEANGDESDSHRQLGSYLLSCLKELSSTCTPSTYNRYLIIDVLPCFTNSKQPRPAAQYAEIFARKLYSEHDQSSAFCHSYVTHELRAAQAHYAQADYVPSIRSLYNAIHRFPADFSLAWNSRDVMSLAIEVLTTRGMVRYTQPHLARLVSACEKNSTRNEDHPFYNELLIAEGAASFDSYIDFNNYEWGLPSIMAPCQCQPDNLSIVDVSEL